MIITKEMFEDAKFDVKYHAKEIKKHRTQVALAEFVIESYKNQNQKTSKL